ncbi:MAG TPA: hypothetical protein VJ808_01790, partial [Gemmatimonadales bacterium]|nr:hypothetical protein [Gemmatimonadales bacterium]
ALRLNGDTSVIAEAVRQALTNVVGLDRVARLEPVPAASTELESGEEWQPGRDTELIGDVTLSIEQGNIPDLTR